MQLVQDLLEEIPIHLLEQVQIVSGPVTGGSHMAFMIAGLLNAQRKLGSSDVQFVPIHRGTDESMSIRDFYAKLVDGTEVLLVDDVLNTGRTFARCSSLLSEAGGRIVATAEMCDRHQRVEKMEGVPNFSLVSVPEDDLYPADACPLCKLDMPITRF
ncbi:MAG: phosphoribosyltransferase [bacterium]|nr:phosphoribosyltransferase [bacterium]